MEEHQFDPASDSLSFPDDTVVGILDDPDSASSAVGALLEGGVPDTEIKVLCCDSGARRLDPTGERHGVLGRLQRLVQHFGDKEVPYLHTQAEALEAGKFLVAAPAETDEESRRVADILSSHGAHFINRYTPWTVERMDG